MRSDCRISGRGSSPHARGTLNPATPEIDQTGIIPACAGNTRWPRLVRLWWRDHPRMRGEHLGAFDEVSGDRGSSPHARGTPLARRTQRQHLGIIPACAGNTRLCADIARRYGDHPRMRGEHHTPIRKRGRWQGSSPHARGTLGTQLRLCVSIGIIPACAGNTPDPIVLSWAIWDHPRMRGEHSIRPLRKSTRRGSSPHARGTRSAPVIIHLTLGIIPACAGNTRRLRELPTRSWDHPRMRGEHLRLSGKKSAKPGSSPHARGTQQLVEAVGDEIGIIPACAGNTHWPNALISYPGDHPRMRGEHP